MEIKHTVMHPATRGGGQHQPTKVLWNRKWTLASPSVSSVPTHHYPASGGRHFDHGIDAVALRDEYFGSTPKKSALR